MPNAESRNYPAMIPAVPIGTLNWNCAPFSRDFIPGYYLFSLTGEDQEIPHWTLSINGKTSNGSLPIIH